MPKKKSGASIPPPKSEIPPGFGGPIQDPNPNDVLSGRGGRINAHEGNVQFRKMVDSLKHVYLAKTTKKLEKAHVADRIVKEIRSMDPPGRFLREDPKTGMWIEIGDEKARKKTGQALREDAPDIRNELDDDEEEKVEEKADSTAVSPIVAPQASNPTELSPVETAPRDSPIVTPNLSSVQATGSPPAQRHPEARTERQAYPQRSFMQSGRGIPQRQYQHMGYRQTPGYERQQIPYPPQSTIREGGPMHYEHTPGATAMYPPQQPYPYHQQRQRDQYFPGPQGDAAGPMVEPQYQPPPPPPQTQTQQSPLSTLYPQKMISTAKQGIKQAASVFAPLRPHRQSSSSSPSKHVVFDRQFNPVDKTSATSGTTTSTISSITQVDGLAQSASRIPGTMQKSLSEGGGEKKRLQGQLKTSDRSSGSSAMLGRSDVSEITFNLDSLRSMGISRSQSFPSMRASDLMSVGDASFQAMLDDKEFPAPPPVLDVQKSGTSSSSSGNASSLKSSSSHAQRNSGSSKSQSSKSQSISDIERPTRVRAQSAQSQTSSFAGMSFASVDSSVRSSSSSWLLPYNAMHSVSSDQNPWNDESSSRSMMSDISADMLALDLAEPSLPPSKQNS